MSVDTGLRMRSIELADGGLLRLGTDGTGYVAALYYITRPPTPRRVSMEQAHAETLEAALAKVCREGVTNADPKALHDYIRATVWGSEWP